jgi:hypothetical protein
VSTLELALADDHLALGLEILLIQLEIFQAVGQARPIQVLGRFSK